MAQETSGSTLEPPTTNDQLSRLCSAVQLDDISLKTLRSLSSLIHDFRQSTTAVHRIQTGSPNARHLGPTVQNYQSEFGSIAGQCQQIFIKHSQIPGVRLLQTRLNELQQTLGARFDDSSKGYGERVHVLEKLNYENGTLRGVVETIIEYHEHWKNKLAGQGNQQPVARCLTFGDTPNSLNVATPSAFLVDQHRHHLSQLQVSQNQSATLSSNQPFQLGQVSFPTLPTRRGLGGSPFTSIATQAQQLGSGSLSSGLSQPLLSTTSGTTGIQALPRPPLGCSQLGLGTGTTNGAVVTHTQPPRGSTHDQVGSGLGNWQFGPGQLGLGLNLQSVPTTSSTTVTRAQHALSSTFNPPSTTMRGGQQAGLDRGALFQQAGGLGRFSGFGGGLGQQASPLTFGTGITTTSATQVQPQRSLNSKFSPLAQHLHGLNLNAPVQPIVSQPNSSSVAMSTAQPSDLVTATLASHDQRQQVMYIPRQPMSQTGGSNNTGQENVAPNTENTEEQSSSQNSGFSLNVDQAIHMCSGITDLWESKRHTDVTFLVQGAQVTAHRIILASQSEYFDRLLFGEMREAREDKIQLSDIENVETFQLLMQYAYSGHVDIQNGDIQDAIDVLKLSDRFGFELLKDTLGDKLIVEINIENILQLLACADLYQVTGLLNECCAFIDQHAQEVLCSDTILTVSDHVLMLILSRDSLCVPEILVFQTVIRWKESNKVNKEEMKNVLDCVRLTEIPPRNLFGEVEKSCLFESGSIMKALRAQNLLNFELMRPRGIKRTGINLMDDAKVDTSTSGSSASNVTNAYGVVFLNPPRSHTSAGTHLLRFSPCETLARVTLKQECLVNTIELEGLPCTYLRPEDEHKETFSYKIYVSKDGKDWIKLFDYSEYSCHSIQRLAFPALVFRMFQFELAVSQCHRQLQLRFLKCSFVEDHKPFKFRENGILAPLFPLEPVAYQTKGATPEVLVAKFCQPYSVSMLSLRICGPMNSVADFIISNSLGRLKYLGEAKAHPFNDQLSVEFSEQVVMSITVEIRNVKTLNDIAPNSSGTPSKAVAVGAATALPFSLSDKTIPSLPANNKPQNYYNETAPACTTRSSLERQIQQVVPVTPTVSIRTRRYRQAKQVDEQKYKIVEITCQLLMPDV